MAAAAGAFVISFKSRTYRWATGRHGHTVPTGHASQARGPGLRPRHDTIGRFSCHAGLSCTAKFAGRASPQPDSQKLLKQLLNSNTLTFSHSQFHSSFTKAKTDQLSSQFNSSFTKEKTDQLKYSTKITKQTNSNQMHKHKRRDNINIELFVQCCLIKNLSR